MISKSKIKFIQSLERKKEREETGLFIAEGVKLITELQKAGFQLETIITNNVNLSILEHISAEVLIISDEEMNKISFLKTPSDIVAIVKQPKTLKLNSPIPNDIILALDAIRDPGNMGTIIRLASWFGIRTIVCSDDSVDCFNPKVVQATMGAIAHVAIIYTHLPDFLSLAAKENRTIYGTFLHADSIYTSHLDSNAIIVLGNEGKGISNEVERFITNKISIPPFSNGNDYIESLNVSIAAAIVCSEFRRRIL
jgi:TrmH family RNA methyltransferase